MRPVSDVLQPRPPRPAPRAAASLLALALVAQAGTVAHELSVRHEVCPEHGELVHVTLQPAAEASGPQGPVLDAAVAMAGDEHEHCLDLFHHRLMGAAPARGAAVGAVGAPPDAEGWQAVLPPPAPLAVLRLAPKASPPV